MLSDVEPEGSTSRVTPFRGSGSLTASQGLYPAVAQWATYASHNHWKTNYALNFTFFIIIMS